MTLDRLRAALDERAAQMLPVRFWLRDDDAVVPSAALDVLLSQAAGLPLTLAVIPKETGASLVERLAHAPGVLVAVHGWDHASRSGPGEKKQELGLHRPLVQVLESVGMGRKKLDALHGDRFVPMLVPPWNRIAADLIPHLPALGFQALSVFGAERAGAIRQINTHVDIIDWKGTRGGRADAVLEDEILAAMARDAPIGILTHHLVHDDQATGFLDRLFDVTRDHPGAKWLSVSDLMSP